jgi:hypothetical protein
MMSSSRALIAAGTGTPQAEDRARQWEKVQAACASTLGDLNQVVSERITRRKPIEIRWMEDLRQYHGQYDTDTMAVLNADKERSRIFINITRPKTNAWRARLADMLFPNDERNWGIDPTPVPELTRDARAAAKEAEDKRKQATGLLDKHNASVDAGGQGNPETAPMVDALMTRAGQLDEEEASLQGQIEEARKRCEAMQRLIDDQLVESRYSSRSRDVIEDACQIGLGVLKGPVVTGSRKQVWQVDGSTGAAQLITDNKPAPAVRRVNYWHFFPDPDSDCVNDGQGTFERHLPNSKMLKRMAKDYDFEPGSVRKMLQEGPRGYGAGSADLAFLTELRSLEGTSDDITSLSSLKNRWVVWEYHGPLEIEQIATMIRALGRSQDADRFEAEANPLDERVVRVFFCDDQLLKIDEDYLLDSGASLYSVMHFEKSEAGIFGAVGVPRLMRSEQTMLNSATRMMMDNAALATGPQIVVDKDAIEPENGSWKLTPRKVWQRTQTAAMGENDRNRPFETFDIPINQQLLAGIIQLALKFVDEAVSMPTIAQGEQGAHVTQTASGMGMLFNSANVVFRRVVKNWDDDVTAGLIQRFFDFNMQFSDDPSVKGDMKVEARGTSVLLVREIQSERLMQILAQWSTHPIMGAAVKAYSCMRLVLQAMSINPDDVMLGEEEYLAKMKQLAESQAQQGDAGDAEAKIKLQIAQMDGDTRVQVAQIGRDTAFAKLASDEGISLKQVEAMFKSTVLKEQAGMARTALSTQSAERKQAAEIGVERQAAREAEAKGLLPTGSGGSISLGTTRAARA